MKISPLAALMALIIVGITIEVVEHQSKQAAYALVILVLLGIVTFNANQFGAQMAAITSVLQRPSNAGGARPAKQSATGQGR